MTWQKLEYATQYTTMPAMICIIDEMASFLNTTERSDMRLVDKFQSLVQEISAIGRSANVHVIMCTQSATGDLFPQRLKNNTSARFICGRVEGNISRMAIDTEEGQSIPNVPGSYLGYMAMETMPFQGYFTQLEEVLSYGTVKEGYNPKTGLLIEEDDDDSPYAGPSLVALDDDDVNVIDDDEFEQVDLDSVDNEDTVVGSVNSGDDDIIDLDFIDDSDDGEKSDKPSEILGSFEGSSEEHLNTSDRKIVVKKQPKKITFNNSKVDASNVNNSKSVNKPVQTTRITIV